MKNPLWLIAGIFVAISVLSFFMWIFGISPNPMQIVVVSILFLCVVVGAVIMYVLKASRKSGTPFGSSSQIKKAEQIAREFWRDFKGEELDDREAHAIRRPFGDGGVAWGLKLHRGQNSRKPGAPVVFIVGMDKGSSSMEIMRWNDHPSWEEQENPFMIFSAGYTGSPFPGMTPDSDASFHRGGFGGRPGQSINIWPKDQGVDDFLSGRRKDERSQ